MNKGIQAFIAICLLAGAVILLAAEMYLIYPFPKTIAVWAEQNRQLSPGEQIMVNLSRNAQELGLPVLAIVAFLLLGSLVSLVVALHGKGMESANQPTRATRSPRA